MRQETLKQITDNLNYLTKHLSNKISLLNYLKNENQTLYSDITKFDFKLVVLEQELQRISKQIDKNIEAAKYRSFFDFVDTPSAGIATLSVGSVLPGSLEAVKVRSTSEIISFDDTPDSYTQKPSVITVSSTDVVFEELHTWRALKSNVLDLSGVTGTGTQITLSGTALDNQLYLLNIGNDTSVPIIIRIGTTVDGARCGFHVYEGEADMTDPSVKYIRAFDGGTIDSIPHWNYDSGYHLLGLYNSLLVRYDTSLGIFITESQYTLPS